MILVENNGGDLHIHYKSGFRINLSTKNVKVKIFAKDFSSIKANSSADVIVKDKFTQDKMSIATSSSGSLEEILKLIIWILSLIAVVLIKEISGL